MQLTEEQKQQVAQWVESGASLSDVQKRLKEEFGQVATYLETRMLLSDLELTVRDGKTDRATRDRAGSLLEGGAGGAETAGGVRVTLSEVTPPHALVSGKAVFSDGVTAEWFIDQMGRLGFQPSTPGYRPSPEDMESFQDKLQDLLQSRGF